MELERAPDEYLEEVIKFLQEKTDWTELEAKEYVIENRDYYDEMYSFGVPVQEAVNEDLSYLEY